jgi:hypothetical protein
LKKSFDKIYSCFIVIPYIQEPAEDAKTKNKKGLKGGAREQTKTPQLHKYVLESVFVLFYVSEWINSFIYRNDI